MAVLGLLVLGAAYSGRTSGQGAAQPAGKAPVAGTIVPESKEMTEARKEILANVRSYMEAFNRRDAKAILALFTDKCTITELDGTRVNGIKELPRPELKDTFADEPKTQVSVDVDALMFVTPDVASRDR